jgi:hypothetical protein
MICYVCMCVCVCVCVCLLVCFQVLACFSLMMILIFSGLLFLCLCLCLCLNRWMKWEPDDMGWSAYIKFEMRQGGIPRARALYERYTEKHQTCRAYLKYARWEERHGDKAKARGVYERSMLELSVEEQKHSLLVSFARFEERCKEFDRARWVINSDCIFNITCGLTSSISYFVE